jgi:hypothetical protein
MMYPQLSAEMSIRVGIDATEGIGVCAVGPDSLTSRLRSCTPSRRLPGKMQGGGEKMHPFDETTVFVHAEPTPAHARIVCRSPVAAANIS